MSPILSCSLAGAWLLLAGLHAAAQASVQWVGLEGQPQTASAVPAVFGGREQKLDLSLKGLTSQVGTSLQADLFQVEGSLAMPLAKDLHLDEIFSLSPTEPWAEQVTLKFPEVKRPTEILIRLSVPVSTPPAHQINQVTLGDLRFEVFPTSVTKDLINLLQPKPDGSAPIVAFGPGQKLRHFLVNLHVPFEDGGTGTPNRLDPNRLYFGELNDEGQFRQTEDRRAGARLVLFSPDVSLPAGVYADRTNSGVFVHVTSPLLDNLADDPRAQLGLIKIIHLLSAQTPSDN